MIKRIELINFMSHRHTVIEPAAGLTVLIGPNNCGKSAIVTALQILCHNDNSTYVLRHGAKECSVIVETDDDHRIQWTRKKSGSPSYIIDGEEFDRLRGESGVWDKLNETLRLSRIDCDKNQFDVHIGEQSNPVFLLNDKGKGAAQFFASSSDAIRLVEMQDLHKARVRENKKEHARLSSQKIQVQQANESLQPIEGIAREIATSEATFAELQSEQSRIEDLEALLDQLKKNLRDCNRLSRTSVALEILAEPPNFADVLALDSQIQSITQTQIAIERARRMAEVFAPLGEPPALKDEDRLSVSIEEMTVVNNAIKFHLQNQQVFEALTEPPQADRSPESLEKVIKEIEDAQASCRQIRELLKTTNERVSEMENAIEQWLSQNPTCPTCGSEVNKEVLLGGGGHRHG